METINIQLSLTRYADTHGFSDAEKEMIQAAHTALDTAYAPYSQFHVGAALLLDDGTIVTGSNQENAAYPSGLCAERVAFFSAGSQHPGKKILAAAVTTSYPLGHPVSPCGACRQVMAEYELKQETSIKLFLCSHDGSVIIANKTRDLLPLYFSGEWLRKG
jgi:cytidine deaminase